MTFLLDTNCFSDLMRKHPMALARLALVSPTNRVVVCSIVRGEILHGIERQSQGRRRQELASQAASLFATIPCEPVPEAAGDHYASVKLRCQRKGLSMDENDLWVAATALALGAVLVSRDSDFQKVGGLTIEDWTA